MDTILAGTTGLLMVAIIVALVARRLSFPYTVGLVATGAGLALARTGMGTLFPPDIIALTHDFIYLVILPPLLFEAALSLHWTELRKDVAPVLVLSTVGVAISAVVVATGMVMLLHWPLPAAVVFGVLIAATDPVAVIALFKDLGLKGRLRLLVESESLFNDGVAAVLFALAIAWAIAPGAPLPGVLPALLSGAMIAGGGIAVGLAVGAATILLTRGAADHLVGAALTTVAAYGSFLLAEHWHFSGVLAVVSAGMLIGNLAVLGSPRFNVFSSGERDFLLGLWEFAAFIANSVIFLLIGVTVADIPFADLGVKALFVTIGLVLLGRFLTVYPLCLLFARSRRAVPIRDQHVLWWGGLRGALGLALALSLPPSLAFADEIKIATFCVVAFSVLLQGMTMPLLLRRLGIVSK